MRASAWLKGMNSLAIPSGLSPIPVSVTRTRHMSAPTTSTDIVTDPPSGVNLIALTRRFKSTCLARSASRMTSGGSGERDGRSSIRRVLILSASLDWRRAVVHACVTNACMRERL